MSLRYKLVTALVAVLAFFGAFWVHHELRTIAFDPIAWREAATKRWREKGNLRFRMADNVVRKALVEKWTLEDALQHLGKPDEGPASSAVPIKHDVSLFYVITKPITNQSFYMKLRFDAAGALLDAAIYPE